MKRIIFIAIALIIIIVVAILVVVSRGSRNGNVVQQAPVGLPTASSTSTGGSPSYAPGSIVSGQSTMTIATHGGSAVVEDFTRNGETWADTVNPGSYILAGSAGYCLANGICPSGATTTDFKITYDSATSFFNIVLLKEPLGATRQAAEQFLESRLGLPQQNMCLLNYFVGAPYYVNQTYAGTNLGFSFCPGATVLPK